MITESDIKIYNGSVVEDETSIDTIRRAFTKIDTTYYIPTCVYKPSITNPNGWAFFHLVDGGYIEEDYLHG